MDSSTEQIHKWAAQKAGLLVSEIDRVYIDLEDGDPYGGCDTCGYGAIPTSIEVCVYDNPRRPPVATWTYIDPTELIREIVSA